MAPAPALSSYGAAVAPAPSTYGGGGATAQAAPANGYQASTGNTDTYGSPSAPAVGGPSLDTYGSPAAPILTPDAVPSATVDDYSSPQAPVVGNNDGYGAPAAPAVGPQPSYGSSQPQPTYGAPTNDCQVTRSLVNSGDCEQGGQVQYKLFYYFYLL